MWENKASIKIRCKNGKGNKLQFFLRKGDKLHDKLSMISIFISVWVKTQLVKIFDQKTEHYRVLATHMKILCDQITILYGNYTMIHKSHRDPSNWLTISPHWQNVSGLHWKVHSLILIESLILVNVTWYWHRGVTYVMSS